MTETSRPLSLWRRVPAWFARRAHVIAAGSFLMLVLLVITLNRPGRPEIGDRFIYLEPDLSRALIWLSLLMALLLSASLTYIAYKLVDRNLFSLAVLPFVGSIALGVIFVHAPFFTIHQAAIRNDDGVFRLYCGSFAVWTDAFSGSGGDHCAWLSCDAFTGRFCDVADVMDKDVIFSDDVMLQQSGRTVQAVYPGSEQPIVEYVIPQEIINHD